MNRSNEECEKLTAKRIAFIVTHTNSPFSIKKNDAVIENVSWGMFEWGEADLLALTKSGYMIEGEIKISEGDILADLKKNKWMSDYQQKWLKDIKNFYYIVPENLVEFCINKTSRAVIAVSYSEKGTIKSRIARQTQHVGGRKLYLEEKVKLLRLGCFRVWR